MHRLRPSFASRSVFTLTTAASFCKKGSLAYFNRQSGEDAFMKATWITPGPTQGTTLIGVCDGVGGWKRYNIDAGILSKALCTDIVHSFEAMESPTAPPDPQALLTQGFYKLEDHGDTYAGGTTTCFGVFDANTAKFKTVNIGDSGFLVLRRGRILYQSQRDVVGMVPKQLAIPPTSLVKDRREQYKKYKLELKRPPWMDTTPEDAVKSLIELQHGDVLVFGTDGLFDNMYNNKILESVTTKLLETGHWSDISGEFEPAPLVHGARQIADMLVQKAYYLSLDTNYPSPFATRSFQEGYIYPGGKPDDITVLVATVNEVETDTPDERPFEHLSAPETTVNP